jgi:chemotaxis protein CheX
MPKIDGVFLKPFIEGTKTTLKVQCGVDSTIGAPYIKGSGPETKADIAAVIGLTSETFNGTLTLLFSKQLYLKAMTNMLGEAVTTINKDNQDGAGELLNIIFGWAKKVLNPKGYTIQKAIPTVLTGDNMTTRQLTTAAVYVLPFKTEFGMLYIEICIDDSIN